MYSNKVVLSIKSFGDFLIIISVLDSLDSNEYTVLTLCQNKNLYEVLNTSVPVEYLTEFNNVPAFFDIKSRGVVDAFKEYIKMRSCLHLYANQIRDVSFYTDSYDLRYFLLLHGFPRCNVYKNGSNIYEDYFYRFQGNKSISVYSNSSKIQSASIFPDSRLRSKCMKPSDIDSIEEIFKKMGIASRLCSFNKNVSTTTYRNFDELKRLILTSEMVVSSDSLVAHLAYYLKVPVFTVFNFRNDYWINPFSKKNNLYTYNNDFTSLFTYLEHKC